MEFNQGEIIISPKIIYWVQMPPCLGEHEKIEFLKRDVLIVHLNGHINELEKIKERNQKTTVFFFNLDEIMIINRIKPEELNDFISKIIKFIYQNMQRNSIVYTSMINKKISDLFKKVGIHFIEKNLNDMKIINQMVLSLVQPLFAGSTTVQRSYLRLNLYPMKYKAIIAFSKGEMIITTNAILKDLSLNGMCMVLNDGNIIKSFKLKQLLEIKLFIKASIIKVNTAILTRIDENKLELGVTYDINNEKMIREDHASYLTGMIYNWVKGIISEIGKIKE